MTKTISRNTRPPMASPFLDLPSQGLSHLPPHRRCRGRL